MYNQRKIPTFLGILLVIVLMAVVGFVFESLSRGQTRASSSIEPKKVTVTNLSDTGFTIVWETEEAATGSILVSSSVGKKQSGFDERDASGNMGKYVTHSTSIRSLTPNTTYTITILSNGKRYPSDAKNYQVTTLAPLVSSPGNIDSAYGKVLKTDGTPAEGALVFLTLENSQTMSTIVRSSGSWIIPLSLIRTTDGESYIQNAERITETIVVTEKDSESRVLTDTLNDGPTPDIILGETYDFRNRDAKKPTTPNLVTVPSKTTTTAVLGAETNKTKTSGSIVLTAPIEGASVSTTRPKITGIGVAGKKVTITLGIKNPIVGSTTVGADGLWNFTSTKPLSPGKQSVTITTVDTKNNPVAITHTFTILKSGTQVLGDATASATLIETPTPTLEPETIEESTIAAEPMPTSGSFLPTFLLLIVGTALFLSGGIAVVKHY